MDSAMARPGDDGAAVTGRARERSVTNAMALWRTFAATRRHHVVEEPGWLMVDSGRDAGGTRVILRGPVPDALQQAALNRLLADARRPVTLEDPSGTVDLTPQGLSQRSLPVMVAEAVPPRSLPAAGRPGITVYRARTAEQLAKAERIMVNGFPLPVYQSSPPGRMLPTGLLDMPNVSIFIAETNDTPAGACMTLRDEHGWGGVYWVTVQPEHRRAGIGDPDALGAERTGRLARRVVRHHGRRSAVPATGIRNRPADDVVADRTLSPDQP